MAPAMDLDPRSNTITLDLRPRTGGSHEIASGAVVRRLFDVTEIDWAPVVGWLESPKAKVLLNAINGGYQAEMLWSGDWHVTWTDSGAEAIQSVLDAVDACARTGTSPDTGAG